MSTLHVLIKTVDDKSLVIGQVKGRGKSQCIWAKKSAEYGLVNTEIVVDADGATIFGNDPDTGAQVELSSFKKSIFNDAVYPETPA